jgi:hypothetical protein
VDHLHVAQAAGRHGALEVAGVPSRALHERDARVGQRRGERQARPPRAGAEVRDPPRLPHFLELERHERVGHVAVDRRRHVAHRRRRGRVGRLQLEDRPQRIGPRRRQRELVEARHARRYAARSRSRPIASA